MFNFPTTIFFQSSLPPTCRSNSRPGDQGGQESHVPPTDLHQLTEPARRPSQQFNVTPNSSAFMHFSVAYIWITRIIYVILKPYLQLECECFRCRNLYFTRLAFTAPRQTGCSKMHKLVINPSRHETKHSDRLLLQTSIMTIILVFKFFFYRGWALAT